MGTIEISTYTVQNYDDYLNVEHIHVCMFIMLGMLEETVTHLFRAVQWPILCGTHAAYVCM